MDDGYRTQTTVTHLPCEHWADYKIGTHITDENFIDESFEVKPIPLTEEWLERFGFEKNEFNSEKYGYGVEYVLETNGVDGFILVYQDDFSIGILGRKEDFGISPNIDLFRNVHQLQNLYFALTGEELELKP